MASGSGRSTNVVSTPNRRERHVEQRPRAAVQLGTGDEMVTGAGERRHREELGGLPAGGAHRADPTLERRQALLERGDGRVRDPAVDRAERLQREQVRRLGGVTEHERRRLVDRHGTRPGGGIGPAAGVHGTGAEPEVPVVGPRRRPVWLAL